MSEQRPVIVYAASGYTGRLTCDWLTRLRIPFVAAGRNQGRLDEVVREMRGKGADCVAQVAEHTPRGLRGLFEGAKVVVNISGPFSLLGRDVVDAALASGCHYLDSTGEQDFMLDMMREFGPSFREAGLLLSPSAAFLWGPGTAAAEVCLETGGVDTLEVIYAPPSLQTVASLQSMVRTFRRPGYEIANGELHLMPVAAVRRFTIAGTGEVRKSVQTGAGEATFFLGDSRVRSCNTYFASNDLARTVPFIRTWARLSNVIPGRVLDRWSDALVVKLKRDPPAEEPESGRYVIMVNADGPGGHVSAVLDGTSPYVVTGFLGAVGAQSVLEREVQRFGYASLAHAFGARYVLDRLEEVGTHMTLETGRREAAAGNGKAAGAKQEHGHAGRR